MHIIRPDGIGFLLKRRGITKPKCVVRRLGYLNDVLAELLRDAEKRVVWQHSTA